MPSGAAGRPKFDIPQEQLQYLIDYEISMTKIAQALGVSKSTAMGTKIAVAFANLFMAEIETKMVNESRIKPKVWKRYINDVFSLWDVIRKDIDLFIEQANTFHPTIKFTAEISENEITFLDTVGYKGERFLKEAILDVETHYKPSETFQCTHYSSCHPLGVKRGFIQRRSNQTSLNKLLGKKFPRGHV